MPFVCIFLTYLAVNLGCHLYRFYTPLPQKVNGLSRHDCQDFTSISVQLHPFDSFHSHCDGSLSPPAEEYADESLKSLALSVWIFIFLDGLIPCDSTYTTTQSTRPLINPNLLSPAFCDTSCTSMMHSNSN
ncbi:uncharacterized protein BDW43DRAFT_20956 [Aspergillus alliaceus]|uniref:uncharacterized protein n=1 Tax=Petromyces alliaceus TaxID=209559 RepID=UPI0012A74395|nr:uncharacterized protein BDW43DRAFT_20956 [Aspergillus alliaceus]KAB8227075.1 hypothetical protein BDW43DRAFT_20956 [Aspergillus alliaceus]